jgi:hypothetical protein
MTYTALLSDATSIDHCDTLLLQENVAYVLRIYSLRTLLFI